MKIDVTSSDDIAALYVTYIELVDSGREATLEITFAPGVYGVASIGPIGLDLGGNPAPRDPKIDVILRGASADPPVVFRDLGLRVNARSLRLERLILTGRNQGLLDARVSRGFVMKDCVIASNEWASPWGGAVMRVSGTSDQPAYTVEIEDSWFVRNGEQSAAALLAVTPASGSFVESVKLRRVTLLDNTMHSDLLVEEARAIHAEDVLVVKRRCGASAFLRYAKAGRVTIADSTFVVDDPAALACEDTRAWSAGMELRGSAIHVTGASRKLPSCVRGSPALLDGSRLALGDALGDAIASITRGIPDPLAARARLREGLGL